MLPFPSPRAESNTPHPLSCKAQTPSTEPGVTLKSPEAGSSGISLVTMRSEDINCKESLPHCASELCLKSSDSLKPAMKFSRIRPPHFNKTITYMPPLPKLCHAVTRSSKNKNVVRATASAFSVSKELFKQPKWRDQPGCKSNPKT